ncbi:MAG TPA: endo alpha-1,4 polygalactosaminidase [Polyangiales bacterium]|jgi:hypothetical protein|nr:endo alpha-1,4 polygalactosaminidase [Polyangiales bacterium]
MDSRAAAETTAFFYGKPIPAELTQAYDQVVVEPGHNHDVAALSKSHAVLVAYLSMGEVAKHKLDQTDKSWRLSQNDAWASTVMDLTHPGYRKYLLDHYEALWSKGYHRFFLDTLDSYQLGTKDAKQRELQRKALCELISGMVSRHAEVRILLNRGFELLPEVGKLVHGVVAESLFDRWDAAKSSYVRVPQNDYEWLVARLREAKDRYHLPVIVIDYRPPEERAEARATAEKIAKLGFEPWVCNSAINNIGVGRVEIMPRKVLIITDKPHSALQPGAARFLAPVLEYLGYVPEYRAIEAEAGLPDYELSAHVAGIISVLPTGADYPDYEDWVTTQIAAGVRVVFFGGLGFKTDSTLAKALGILPLPAPKPGRGQVASVGVMRRDELIGFEAEPPARGPDGVPITLEGPFVSPHLTLRTGQGATATAIATTRFGGIALSHVFAVRGLSGERAWVVDPFKFLQRALHLPDIPVPDITTESGRRLALLAIDARGLSDNARLRGRPRVVNVLATQILQKFNWPHALDLREPEAKETERARDAAAARTLLQKGQVYRADVPLDESARGALRSLTELPPLWAADDPELIPLPIAADYAFIGAVPEAYPLRRVSEVWQATEAPRRLRPIALHYHAFVLSSPGGLAALTELYRKLQEMRVQVLRFDDYRARIRAFREQVIVRSLDGSFTILGGEALRTLRVPASLGEPDVAKSEGVAGVADAGTLRYVTFVAKGPRKLQLAPRAPQSPQISQTNGRVEHLRVLSPTCLELSLTAADTLDFCVSGLPAHAACTLQLGTRSIATRTDARGELHLTLAEPNTGLSLLSCDEAAS